MHIVAEAVIVELQAYPTPKNMKGAQAFTGIWVFFISHLALCLHPLYCLVKKGHMWDWVSEQQATSARAGMLVKQTETLSISQAGLPLDLAASMTLKGIHWAL